MGLEDVSLMRALPNMKVLNPATYTEAVEVIKYLCNTDLDSPHYLRLGRQPVEDVFEHDYDFEFGKGVEVIGGNDITIISTGCVLSDVLDSAKTIEEQTGKSVRVINIHTLKPIDEEIIIKAAKETDLIVTVEDHSIIGGLGSAVSEVLTEHYPSRLVRIGLNDEFPESGPPVDLYEKYGLSSSQISKRVINELDK
jgi:transketolase